MDFCDERFSRTLDKLDTIGKKVDKLSEKFDGFKTKEEKEAEAEARELESMASVNRKRGNRCINSLFYSSLTLNGH